MLFSLEDIKCELQRESQKYTKKRNQVGTKNSIVTPSTKQFALIYILPKLSNSEYTKQISVLGKKNLKLLLELAGKELRQKIKELDEGEKRRIQAEREVK